MHDDMPAHQQQIDEEERSFEHVNLKGDNKSSKPRPQTAHNKKDQELF